MRIKVEIFESPVAKSILLCWQKSQEGCSGGLLWAKHWVTGPDAPLAEHHLSRNGFWERQEQQDSDSTWRRELTAPARYPMMPCGWAQHRDSTVRDLWCGGQEHEQIPARETMISMLSARLEKSNVEKHVNKKRPPHANSPALTQHARFTQPPLVRN